MGLGRPPRTHYLPWDLSTGAGWLPELLAAGFDPGRPTVVGAAGLTMYLDDDANRELLAATATLGQGTTLVVSVMVPPEELAPSDRPFRSRSRSPFRTHYGSAEILRLVEEAGFGTTELMDAPRLHERYFAARPDGLSPSPAEAIVIASR